MTPSGTFGPKPHTKRDGKVSTAACMGIVELIVVAKAAAHDQRVGSGTTQRSGVGPPPEQGQRHRNHSGPQHRQEGQREFDGVGDLQADDRIRAQPDPAQPAGDGRYHMIGLRIGEGAAGNR